MLFVFPTHSIPLMYFSYPWEQQSTEEFKIIITIINSYLSLKVTSNPWGYHTPATLNQDRNGEIKQRQPLSGCLCFMKQGQKI